MSDQKTVSTGSTQADGQRSGRSNPVSRLFRAIGLFVSQVIDEMRKVVPPTRQELMSYWLVVIVFVVVVMLVVFGLDVLFTKIVFWIFAGSS